MTHDHETADRLARRMGGEFVADATRLDEWTRRVTVVALRLQTEGRVADLPEIKAVLAAKPDRGLDQAWFDVVEALSAWVERAERIPLLTHTPADLLRGALAAPPQRRYAWQDRADA